MTFKTLKELYLRSIATYSSNNLFSTFGAEENSMTYAEMAEKVDMVITMLTEAGIESGDKVALLSNNKPNWAVCYFATVISGMVIVPILPDFSGSELDKIIRHSESKALFASDKLFAKVGKDVVESLNLVVRTKNLAVISQKVFEKTTTTEPKADDLAAIIYTSGTTSSPKGVMLTHYNLAMQSSQLFTLFPLKESDVYLSLLPLSHTLESSLGMIYPIMCGASVTYLDRAPTPSVMMPALKKVKPTVMLSVPLIIEKIFRTQILSKLTKGKLNRTLYNIKPIRKILHIIAGKKLYEIFGGRLRFFGIGGAKLDSQTEQFLLDCKFPYAIGYGLTETAPLVAGATPDIVTLGSTGPAMRGVKVRLDNMDPTTQEGEIVVSSPCVMQGYFKNPEATAEVFTEDGWFRTKDLGYLDKNNFLYIKGRLNNMIVGPSGENIYPEDIENVLSSHLLVSEAIVMQDQGKLVALVQFNREELERRLQGIKDGLGYKMDEIKSEVMQYVNSKVSKFSRISHVEEQKDDFEKTPTYKIKRFLYTPSSKDDKRQNNK